MIICILCEDSKIEIVRESAKAILTNDVLRVPLSSDGKLPASHWFCSVNVTQEYFDKLKALQNHSVMENSEPRKFLDKWKLRIAR